MSDAISLIKSYNERGLASVLDGADDLIKRAAGLYRSLDSSAPPAVKSSYRKEAEVCLAEAEELIAAVRSRKP